MLPMEFSTKQELQDFLNNFDFDSIRNTKMSSVYFLTEFDNHIAPIYFWRWSDVWFPAPCELFRYPLKDDESMEFVKDLYNEEDWEVAYEYEKSMVREDWHYEIHCPQCTPFLPDNIKIVMAFSDSGCLDWMLKRKPTTEEEEK